MHLVCAITGCLVLAGPAPGTPPADNWGRFLFFFSYGEIDPFDSPWHPVRHPVFQRTFHRMGVNVSCPIAISTDIRWGLRHRWTTEWLKHPDSVTTPWYFWGDCAHKRAPEAAAPYGCYNNPKLKPHFMRVLKGMRDAYGERILRVRGRPVINFEKENPYTYSGHRNRHYCEHCRASFRGWLQRHYSDASPAADTNGDGATLNAQCGTGAKRWADVIPDEKMFRALTADKYRYPYLQFLWREWLADNAWGDLHADVCDKLGIWQFCTQHMPARYLAKQPFFYCEAFTSMRRLENEDYWTRRDPNAIAVAYSCALYRTNANTDPYYYDRFLASVCGQISRFRGIYQISFDSNHRSEYARHQVCPRTHPGCIEAHSWWAHTIAAQRWLFDQLLTAAPQVAIYPGEEAFPSFSRVAKQYTGLVQAGYPVHFLDRERILAGALRDYRVLLVNGERIPRDVLQAIVRFRKSGGYVCGFSTAATWSLRQPEPELFRDLFGATVSRVVVGRSFSSRPDKTSPVMTDSQKIDTIVVYKPTVPDSPIWKDVKPFEGYRSFRDDIAVLVKPVTATPLATVTTIDAKGETCMTLSRDGRALFLGMHQGSSPTLRIGFVTNFVRPAEVTRAVAWDNPAIEAYRLESADRPIQLVVLINNDLEQSQPVAVTPRHVAPGTRCGELHTIRELPLRDGRVSTSIPPGQVRLLLLAPQATLTKAFQVQRRVHDTCRVLPWHCSRHFFVRRKLSPRRGLWKPFLQLPAEPNAVIVLGDQPPADDTRFAQTVATLIRDWPMAKNKVLIPVTRASALSADEAKKRNLLLIGGPDVNARTQSELARVGLKAPAKGIISHHERGWYTGDNFVAICGTAVERNACFAEFLEWMRVWMDSYAGYTPDVQW